MTKGELTRLLALPAGRELDAAVAEHVFDGIAAWYVPPYKMLLCEFQGTGYCENRGGTISEFCVKCGDPYGYHNGFPAFSTDITAAWIIVEQMAEHHFVNVGNEIGTEDDLWFCEISSYPIDECVCAITAPLAICRAALQVKSSETVNASQPTTE
jgi:hypothetical protein